MPSYRPSPFVPNTSFSGEENSLVIAGENMFLRFGRFGASVYATGYKGSQDLSETVPTKTLTGTISWTAESQTVVGVGTLFIAELHLGSFVFGNGGAGATELLVVEQVIDDTHFIATSAPTASASTKAAYVLGVIDVLGTDRATMIRGKVLRFPKGHLLGVGDGEVKINGASLSSTFNLSKTPRFALYNPSAGTYTQADVGQTLPSPTSPATTAISTAAVTPSPVSQMRAGDYMVRVCAYNSETLGFSNPSDVISVVTLTDGQAIEVTFNGDMNANQNGYLIFCTPFKDSADTNIEAAYMGAWFLVKTVTATDLIDGGHPTGREDGTTTEIAFSDSEVALSNKVLTFDNFAPKEAEFVDLINGIPIYLSCLGKGNASKLQGTSPGACAIASKPSNPEAVLLNKAVTTALGDYIVGAHNFNARIYALCQSSLQTLILTTIDSDPITFRSLWNGGFRNPYNAAFFKNYLFGFSTQGIIRTIAGGDNSDIEFEFALDVGSYVENRDCGKVLSAYDPKNRAMCFFLSAAERRSGYWVTIVLPFLVDKQVWNPPIVLKKANTDFIVSGVATVGANLEFIAGGRTASNTIVTKTYRFDGGDSDTKDWFLAWNYSDDGREMNAKTIKGGVVTGRFASSDTKLDIYGVRPEGEFALSNLQAGTNANCSIAIGQKSNFGRKRMKKADTGEFSLYTVRMSGSYTGSTTDTVDRIDEIVLKTTVNSSES